jgi:hypothetical protein
MRKTVFHSSLRLFSLGCFFAWSFLEADKGPEDVNPKEIKVDPWFTGPLLASSAEVVPLGFINIEPYLFTTVDYANYNQHWHSESTPNFYSVNPEVVIEIGIAKNVHFQFTPQIFWNESEGKSSARVGDLPVELDFQLVTAKDTDWWPNALLFVQETFPTGHYQRLNPKKKGVDITGFGSFSTSLGLAFSKQTWFGGAHWLSTRFNFIPRFSLPVHVKGFNTYGGGYGTRGKVYPGVFYQTILAFEFAFTRNWAFAIDLFNAYGNKTRFKGKPGVTSEGARAKVGHPSFTFFSLAPAIEYNWNESLGIIAGCWFTVAGRNTGSFASAVIALNYYGPITVSKKEKPEEESHGGGGGSGSGGGGSGGTGGGGK